MISRKPSPLPRGFALVISLALMVLLMVVAVGLLTLSSLALRSSSRTDAVAEARANARLALVMAIGELQRSCGPDKRITATADLAGTALGDSLPAGTDPLNNLTVNAGAKGLSRVQPGTRYWTGVWENADVPMQIYTKTPSPRLRGWLVSGNEKRSVPSRWSPASPEVALGADGSPTDPKLAVTLVGKHSVGSDAAGLQRQVAAPLVEMGGRLSSSQPTGRHAWWIADEAVKARLNQTRADKDDRELTYENLSDLRSGWENVDGFADYPVPGRGDPSLVGRVVTPGEAALLSASLAQGKDSPLRQSFHAATTDSFGLLTDSLKGGQRVDLCPYLESGFPEAPEIPGGPSTSTNIIPQAVARSIRGPRWSRLKDFHDMVPDTGETTLVVKPAADDSAAAISPTIAELRLLFGTQLVPGAADEWKIHPCAKVAIALTNPYSYPLKWNGPLDLEILNSQPSGTQGVPADYKPTVVWHAVDQPAFVPATSATPAVLNNAIFRIDPDELQPGEAKAFTMASRVNRPVNSTARVIIPLKQFSSARPGNFENCVILAHDSVNPTDGGKEIKMDVRETWTTTQIDFELRTTESSGGSGSTGGKLLRRIERFELDNGYFATTQRLVGSDTAKAMTKPFPLQYYCFQLSQPGNDYKSLLPNLGSDPLGLRGSTLRSFADFNFQGKRFHKAITSYCPPPYFMESADSFANLPFNPPGGETGDAFTRNFALASLGWGRSPFDTKKVVLFSPQEKFHSLAQLQHADLTADDRFGSVGHQPGNAVGNSYATPFVKRALTIQQRKDYTITGEKSQDGIRATAVNYYDIAYLLNAALWDGYFFSGLDGSSSTLSPALTPVRGDAGQPGLDKATEAAAHLFINGAFNVNSTSKDAWKALLAGSKHLKHAADAAEGISTDALYPRSLSQLSAAASPPTGIADDSFSGFRRLTDAQLDALATELTRQVRVRGPFLSLSHFVNRALADLNRNKVLSRSGALQMALDESGLNINQAGSKNVFSGIVLKEERLNLQQNNSSPRADFDGPRPLSYKDEPSEPVWAPSSKDLNPGAVASILADRPMLTDARLREEQGYRSTGIPGWITQADLLQVLGPSLAVRSDTFRIRSYGEALDDKGTVTAKAWCEAVVQRMPDYVDPADPAIERDTALTAVNQRFGRRFHLVSFRWLSPQEV